MRAHAHMHTHAQVHEECAAFLQGTHLRALALHGGLDMATEVRAGDEGGAGRGFFVHGACLRTHTHTPTRTRAQVLAIRRSVRGGGADVVVATPGRLMDHVAVRGSVRLERLAHLVVDEAGTLLDLGFEPELRRCGL